MSDEEIATAYMETGSIWKAGKRLGVAGQSVHERLRRLGIKMAHQKWSRAEVEEARSLAAQGEPMAQIAARIGRTYFAVALKLSRLRVRSRHMGWRWKPRRTAILTKTTITRFARELNKGEVSIRRLARREGLAITPLVDALQVYAPVAWRRYVERFSIGAPSTCSGCGSSFRPLTKRQLFCTVRCRESYRRNIAYFGGRRQEAVGLQEGICQLCQLKVEKWLSAHHILGRENDPENKALIALCRGCHDLVTRLSAKSWADRPDTLADLIGLALARRGKTSAFVSVDIEDWTSQEIKEFVESSE
ncbi:MAG: HNH endonuclease [Methanobacteriota archaeon]|nr:MAG: HNH endonuclease [Euryarchaeota archaeon]